jgi:SAM-dependent methyltransferase
VFLVKNEMRDSDLEKAALRGEPSYVWRSGQERRLQMILREAGLQAEGSILDLGCGVGTYLRHLAGQAKNAIGVELDFERAKIASTFNLTIVCSAGENLPFASHSFDMILSHEVLEHVVDDRTSLEEIARTLRLPNRDTKSPGGRLILFLPNRGYPFETHGIYWGGKYHFGNVPFVNYLPKSVRNRLAPHVRVYSTHDLIRLLHGLPFRVLHRTIIFGAYDNIISRWPAIGRILRAILHTLERTPFRVFGLSHFWVLERTESNQ